MVGMYDPDGKPQSGDEIYTGASLDGLKPGKTIQKHLQIIVKAN